MARKNLMKGLMGEDTPRPDTEDTAEPAAAPERGSTNPSRPRYNRGAIGAVSQSIAELKTRSIVEIDPFQIDAGGLKDRLEHDEAEHARLMDSIRLYGQQVPILVRQHPETPERYQIVYGRRRVLATRDLGMPVKAMVRDLDDREAILAQGQENSARRDLSFIERVTFARQMVEAGYERKIIADALSTDKTLISRMISVSETLPQDVIDQIGAAPSVGRDRWMSFAREWTRQDLDPEDAGAMLAACNTPGSDARFEFLLSWLERRARGEESKPAPAEEPPRESPPAPERRDLTDADGITFGRVSSGEKSLRIELHRDRAAGFEEWLSENLERLHRDWLAGHRDE